jgi:hypothetical protein
MYPKYKILSCKPMQKWHVSCTVLGKRVLPSRPWCLSTCFHPWIPCGRSPKVELVLYKQKHIYQYFMHEVDGSNARDNIDLDLMMMHINMVLFLFQ